MDHKRTTGWGLTRNEAALLGAIIGYGILVVVVTPLLLGFLPILAVGWMLRVPVASSRVDRSMVEISPSEPLSPVATSTASAAAATTPVASRRSAMNATLKAAQQPRPIVPR